MTCLSTWGPCRPAGKAHADALPQPGPLAALATLATLATLVALVAAALRPAGQRRLQR